MRRPLRLWTNSPDAGLKLTGLALAAASATFAFSMTGAPSTPRIQGLEHLAIYARPAHRGSSAGAARAIDYAPTGSTQKGEPSLAGYEIIEATLESAQLRLPEGRVTRVARGSRIPLLGAVIAIERRGQGWAIVTKGGVIH